MPCLAVARGVRRLRGAFCPARAALPHLRVAGSRRRGPVRRVPDDTAPAGRLSGRRGLRLAVVALHRAVQVRRPTRLGRRAGNGDAQHALGRARAGPGRPGAADAAGPRAAGGARFQPGPAAGATPGARARPTRACCCAPATRRRKARSNARSACATCRAPSPWSPCAPHELQGQRVVLVDDVMTSGASLHAAALTVRQAGAAHVTALVFARTE